MHGKYRPGLANRPSRHQKTGKSQFLHDSRIRLCQMLSNHDVTTISFDFK